MPATKDIDTISTADYKNPENLLVPKSDERRIQYFEIYEEYVLTHQTYQQLAQKFGYSLDHIARIVKWAVYQVEDKADRKVWQSVIHDKISFQLQTLENILIPGKNKAVLSVKEQLAVIGEIRRNIKLLGQVAGIMAGDNQKTGDAPQVSIFIPNLNQGKGAANAIEIKTEQNG